MSAKTTTRPDAAPMPEMAALNADLAVIEAKAIGVLTEDNLTAGVAKLVASLLMKPKHRGPTEEEVALFIGQCIRTQLDPFARQIFAVYRKDNAQGGGAEVLSIQTGIDGFRLIAERTGKYEGGTDPEWCDKDGTWTSVWIQDAAPFAARIGVHKTGAREATRGVAYFSMYGANASGPLWKTAGGKAHMLAKCSEAIALRRAFPQELSGLYTVDEIDPTREVIDAAVVEQPDAPELPPHAEGVEAMSLDGEIYRLMAELGYSDARARAQHDGYRTLEQKQELRQKLAGLLDERDASS